MSGSFVFWSYRQQDDDENARTHQKAGEISECEGNGVLVEFAA